MVKTFQLRTDFCDELIIKEHHDDKISCVIKQVKDCKITQVKVKEDDNIMQKKIGDYITIEFKNMHDYESRDEIIKVVKEELQNLFDKINKEVEKILVVGLGNRDVVSDALGPKSADEVLVTAHLYEEKKNELLEGTRNVAVLSPGVMGQTGLESADVVSSIVNLYKPDMVIVIDALATSSLARINRAVQLNDIGITPGSGVGNHRSELSETTLGIPVIAIGVATVTSIGTIIKEAFIKLDNEDMMEAMNEVSDLSLIVTPKSMDDELSYLITILSEAINQLIHPNYNLL